MLTESAIETFAIKLFERLSYIYLHSPDIAPDSDSPERSIHAFFDGQQQVGRALHFVDLNVAVSHQHRAPDYWVDPPV